MRSVLEVRGPNDEVRLVLENYLPNLTKSGYFYIELPTQTIPSREGGSATSQTPTGMIIFPIYRKFLFNRS